MLSTRSPKVCKQDIMKMVVYVFCEYVFEYLLSFQCILSLTETERKSYRECKQHESKC